ncbi:MAG: hypothetical protein ACKVON_08145 [Beijerinckiaceae bacterium]
MVEIVDAKISTIEHIDLVSRSFPEIACLRCGSQDFGILPDVEGPSGLGVITMACMRCGHIEQHMISTLQRALNEGMVPFPLGKADVTR